MKKAEVQQRLKTVADSFNRNKKIEPRQLLDEIVQAMLPIGGIAGFCVSPYKAVLINHSDVYCMPVKFEEYRPGMSYTGKRAIQFLELLISHLQAQGAPAKMMQYHLGRHYSSKHHRP